MADAHVRRQAATMRRAVSWESRARYLIQALACACVCVMPTRTVQGGAAAAGAAAATDIEPDTAALLTWLRAEGAQLDGISIGPGAKGVRGVTVARDFAAGRGLEVPRVQTPCSPGMATPRTAAACPTRGARGAAGPRPPERAS